VFRLSVPGCSGLATRSCVHSLRASKRTQLPQKGTDDDVSFSVLWPSPEVAAARGGGVSVRHGRLVRGTWPPELRPLGFKGSAQTVRRYLRPFRVAGASPSRPDPYRRKQAPTAPAVPKPRTISKALLTHPGRLTENDALIAKNATADCPHLERLQQHIRAFAKIMTQRRGQELPSWLDAAEADDLPALHSLATGMRRDLAAVINGLTLEHSSGAVEGNLTRIKRLKRDGYGRAKFDLLRAQILLAT
jgi:hypothetical protein